VYCLFIEGAKVVIFAVVTLSVVERKNLNYYSPTFLIPNYFLGEQHPASYFPFLPLYVPIFFILEEKIKKDFHCNRAQLFPFPLLQTFKI